MKKTYKGFIVKVEFWGDSITPIYRFRLYKPRKFLPSKLVWTQTIHRSDIKGALSSKFDFVIESYLKELDRWK